MKTLKTVGLILALSAASLSASVINVSDAQHIYTFTRSDGGTQVSVSVPPWPGKLDLVSVNIACLDYTKGGNFNTDYQGSLHAPTTEAEVESAYLSSQLAAKYAGGAALAVYAPYSLAIWQTIDPVLGDVPRDPAAQTLVTQAKTLYSSGQITAAMFANFKIFVPNDPTIQRFITVQVVPEPGTIVLLTSGGILLLIGTRRFRGRKL